MRCDGPEKERQHQVWMSLFLGNKCLQDKIIGGTALNIEKLYTMVRPSAAALFFCGFSEYDYMIMLVNMGQERHLGLV